MCGVVIPGSSLYQSISMNHNSHCKQGITLLSLVVFLGCSNVAVRLIQMTLIPTFRSSLEPLPLSAPSFIVHSTYPQSRMMCYYFCLKWDTDAIVFDIELSEMFITRWFKKIGPFKANLCLTSKFPPNKD